MLCEGLPEIRNLSVAGTYQVKTYKSIASLGLLQVLDISNCVLKGTISNRFFFLLCVEIIYFIF
jgi:hypothetical protein